MPSTKRRMARLSKFRGAVMRVVAGSRVTNVREIRPSYGPDSRMFGRADHRRQGGTVDEIDAWMVQGLCYGASSVDFFPSTGAGVDAARRVCMQCPVREQCLDYALRNQIDHGLWGG